MTSGFCELPGAAPGNDAGGVADVAPDAPRSAFCSVPGTVACYEFEGNAKDGSGNGLDATTTNVTFVPGKVGQAMLVGTNSSATVNANNLFDNVSAFTIEAWIRPSALPGSSSESDILAVLAEYEFGIVSNGALLCAFNTTTTSSLQGVLTTTTAPVNQWTHVACTYDGAALNVYINGSGSVAGTRNVSGVIPNGANDMGISWYPPSGSSGSGFQLIGLIDQLRLLNVARSAAEICADTGQTSCH
jgi:hypothetical protein